MNVRSVLSPIQLLRPQVHLLLVLALGGVACDSPLAPEAIDDIEVLMAEYDVPGVSIAVFRDGQVVLETYGVKNAETREPVTSETLFQAASISKMVTAAATLKYVQEGALSLDAPVNGFLTSWQIPENSFTNQRAVTLRHLLSHTAGTTVPGFLGYARGAVVPTLVQVLNGSGPANSPAIVVDKTPGGAFRYSGGGYTIIQQLLVDLAGSSFPDLMREAVLAPIGMSSSTFERTLPAQLLARTSVGHRSNGDVVKGGFHVYPEMAAASLWSTPAELAKFAMELQRTLAGQSQLVLSQTSAELMVTPVSPDYGLGSQPVRAGGERYFSHTGHNEGFESLIIGHETAGWGTVIMMNGEGNGVLNRILQIIGQREGWPGF